MSTLFRPDTGKLEINDENTVNGYVFQSVAPSAIDRSLTAYVIVSPRNHPIPPETFFGVSGDAAAPTVGPVRRNAPRVIHFARFDVSLSVDLLVGAIFEPIVFDKRTKPLCFSYDDFGHVYHFRYRRFAYLIQFVVHPFVGEAHDAVVR